MVVVSTPVDRGPLSGMFFKDITRNIPGLDRARYNNWSGNRCDVLEFGVNSRYSWDLGLCSENERLRLMLFYVR